MLMNSDNADPMIEQAYAHLDAGRMADALTLFTQICEVDANNAEAWLMRSSIAGEQGNIQDAISFAQKAIDIDPEYEDAYVVLAHIYSSVNRFKDAADCYEKAVAIDPDLTEAWQHLSGLYGVLGSLEDAERCCRQVLTLQPENAEARVNLGNALFGQKKNEEASAVFKEALELAPDLPELHTCLGNCQLLLNHIDESIACFERALELRPGDHMAFFNLGRAYQQMGQFDEALRYYEQVLSVKPGFDEVLAATARLYEKKGDYVAANKIVRKLIDKEVNNVEVAVLLSLVCRKFDSCDEAIERMEALLTAGIDKDEEYISLNSALGGLYDRAGRYEEAFACYKNANEKQRTQYDRQEVEERYSATKTVFSREQDAQLETSSNQSELPVFIVGMPRSGTSLVEQIMSCHPDIHAGGELFYVSELVGSLSRDKGRYPDCMRDLSAAEMDDAGEEFVQKLKQLSADAERITDKMPHNFTHLGLIHHVFPRAKIIHCVRNPVDTCLACYFARFGGHHQHPYLYDLEDIGHHYNEYLGLMKHWQEIGIPMLEVSYESLVENQEKVSKEIIEYLGLQWNDDCLRFHESSRYTKTLSYNQVRKPIYNKSVNRWKHYESHLQPLFDVLNIEK
jgi:tetratricopeptide (TPR) repeat protein